MTNIPQISVIMSTYRECEEYIRKSIESILNQTFNDFEFIIVLDDPTNKSLKEIIYSYKKIDNRIVFIQNEKNVGLANSLNIALNFAKSSIIARMDADDISLPNRLEKEYNFLRNHSECKAVSVNKINIDENGKVLSYGGVLPESPEIISKGLHYINMVLHPGAMFYKESIIKIGGYRDIVPAEDHDLWLRMVNSDMDIRILNDYLLKYRISNQSISSSSSLRMWLTDKYVRKINNKKGIQFSKSEYLNYMSRMGAYDSKKKHRFGRAIANFYKSNIALNNKKYFIAFKHVCKSIACSLLILDVYYCFFKYKRIIKKYK